MIKKKVCKKCGNGSYGDVCWSCKGKEKAGKKIETICRYCGEKTLISLAHKKESVLCKSCLSKKRSSKMKETRSKESKEQRSDRGRMARKQLRDESLTVRKQWQTIRSNKELFEKISLAKSLRGKAFWKTLSEEEREERIKKSLSGAKRRSKGSQTLKNLMLENGILGFESEGLLSGFVPDEVDHTRKIVIEYYGDMYHCNPKDFKDPDLFLRSIQRTVGEQWKRDSRRLGCFYGKGYHVIIVWESDFNKDPLKEIQRIKDYLNSM